MMDEDDTSGARVEPLPPLSRRQQDCLAFVWAYYIQHGRYPTQREITRSLGIKSATAEGLLEPLRKKGYLTRRLRRRRNIRLTKKCLTLLAADAKEQPVGQVPIQTP